MIRGLGRFVVELRREGLSVSPAEWLDAMHAVALIGVADRRRFRQVLRCTLAKHRSQRIAFDRAFERFFATPRRARSARSAVEGGAGRTSGQRPAGNSAARSTPPRTVPPTDVRRSPARAARDDPQSPRRALERLVEQARGGAAGRRTRLRRVCLETEAVDDRGQDSARHVAGPTPASRDLRGRMSLDDERTLAAEVPRLIRRLRLGTGRRLRRARRGRVYPRAVFRDNLRHGGIPWTLPRRHLRRRRTRVVLLIDVSWSTARAAGLFLAMAREFLLRARRTRVLLFVDRAVDATAAVEHWLDRGARHAPAGPPDRAERGRPAAAVVRRGLSFDALVAGLPGLNSDAPSDYGRTFHALLRSPRRPAGRNTLLLVLGDGRTNRLDAQAWAFEEIAERCGAVIWLVPETLAEWGTGDSALDAYLPWVDTVVEARDLAGLSRGVAELARRL